MENYSSKKTPKLYQMSMMYLANKLEDDSYQMFIRMDKNKDGTINKEEFKSYLGKNKVLTNESHKGEKIKQIFEQIDQDQNGVI